MAFDAVAVTLATCLLGLVALAPVLDRLKVSWGPGDLLSHYVDVSLWGGFGYQTSNHYGFPLGINKNLFPSVDITQNTIAHTVSALFGDPFIGLNVLALLSFPLTALAALVAFRLVRLTGWWAIALSVSYTFLPYHWGRLLGHTYLGTMYAAATGVILALIIGQGRLSNGRLRSAIWWITAFLVIVTAWSNVYYAAFGLMLMITALLFRVLSGDRFQQLAKSSIPILATFLLVVVGFLPSIFARLAEPEVAQLGSRFSYESVTLAGSLSMLVLPAPVSQLPYMGYYNEAVRGLIADAPRMENVSDTNFGSWVLLAAMLFLMVWWILRKRSGRRTPRDLRLTTLLTVVSLAFFIPWGLNSLLAEFVTAQIRAWNRLVPTLALLILLSTAVALRSSRFTQGRWRMAVPVAILVVVVVEQVVPYRAVYLQAVGRYAEDTAWAREYAQDVNAAIAEDCGILQLPTMVYPENGSVPPALNDYEHFWQPLTNPSKDFSFGAVRFSDADRVMQDLDFPLTPTKIEELQSLGFCAIHLDLRGYQPDEQASTLMNASQWLGSPAATGREGDWVLYRLA